MVLSGFVVTHKLIVTIIIAVKVGLIVGLITSMPAEEIVAPSTGRELATITAKDVLPPAILTELTASRSHRRSVLISEIVVITVDLQSLLELC